MATAEQHRADFGEAIEKLKSLIREIFEAETPDLGLLDGFDDCVFVKNDAGTVVFANSTFRQRHQLAGQLVGRQARGVLMPAVADLAHQTDNAILLGCDTIECEYTNCSTPDGNVYRVRCYKHDLRPFRRAGYAILGMSRRLHAVEDKQKRNYNECEATCATYYTFDPRDREICRLTALGLPSKEIGQQLGMTGRNVDIRRRKVFEGLGVEKPIDLARLLVRLQERGYLDLGL